MIHPYNCWAFMILVLFTVPFYHFLFWRYLVLAECHFLSDILVPFSDLSNLYSCGQSTASSHIFWILYLLGQRYDCSNHWNLEMEAEYLTKVLSLFKFKFKHLQDKKWMVETSCKKYILEVKKNYRTYTDCCFHFTQITKVVIIKMFGLHHTSSPKIFFKFSGIFGAEGWAFWKF